MKAKNEKEFLNLIKKYNSITVEEIDNIDIEDHTFDSYNIMQQLTGFGTKGTCMLCKPCKIMCEVVCDHCIYGIMHPSKSDNACVYNDNAITYNDLDSSESSEELLLAIKARVKHMKKVYKKYQKQLL